MSARALNWPAWTGFLLTIVAFLSYPLVFARFPATRDFPWVNILLFVLACWLLYLGVRRAFLPDSTRVARIAASVLGSLGLLVTALFVFTVFVFARQLPASAHAPRVGETAPEFKLADVNGKDIYLAEILTAPVQGKAPKGALLIFYRGYW